MGFHNISKYGATIDFGIGIDCGTVLCTKMCIGGGNNSSLAFTGNCVNKATLLGKMRNYPNNIGISDAIYNNLDDSHKYKKATCDLDNKEYLWQTDYINYNDKSEFCYSTTYCCVL